ncbi:MAG: hypothetical protein JO078_08940 [Candidatus Eremiobacteraeota bacterium]|nr:hypothetical protein [Candidatus Eremiobacteraeota bacterium]MBV9700236.1 hypothetical protein [Candidatus Eremiobacteraeota bacterium]
MTVRLRPAYVAALIAFGITAAASRLHATPYNNYVLLAQAFLHGRPWIDWPGPYIDALPYAGQYYIIEGPLPAVLLLPFVALLGGQTNQTLLSAVLAAVAVGAGWELGERFGVRRANIAWISAFLLAGTDLLWCAMLGDVWFTAQVAALCFTLLALLELAGKRRGWLVALWAACAAESRFSMALAIPVYVYLLVASAPASFLSSRAESRDVVRRLAFVGVLVAVGIVWVLYNLARWGTWNDIGYLTWYHQDRAGMPTGSPFRLEYLPYQLWSFFVQTPTQLSDFPGLRPEISGVALTWTSPALIIAFLARAPSRWVIALWVAALLTAAPNFLYYVNGFAQFGMRHALDFEPFLVVLMLLAAREGLAWWGRALILYSCAAGLWGCWYWLTYVRT